MRFGLQCARSIIQANELDRVSSFVEMEPFPGIVLERLKRSDSAVGKIVAIGPGMALRRHSSNAGYGAEPALTQCSQW
jgi:hypothetical protein